MSFDDTTRVLHHSLTDSQEPHGLVAFRLVRSIVLEESDSTLGFFPRHVLVECGQLADVCAFSLEVRVLDFDVLTGFACVCVCVCIPLEAVWNGMLRYAALPYVTIRSIA